MRIALVGYGKMGKEIERLAVERGHEISLRVDSNNLLIDQLHKLGEVDVAIEFSTPEAAYGHLSLLLDAKVPVVCGTTAWLDKREEVEALCQSRKTGFFYASNFSLGVNLFFKLNQHLAKLMAPFEDQYKVRLKEIHHTTKLDAPSGTAISLAEDLINILPGVEGWTDKTDEKGQLHIESERLPNVPGTHFVNYRSEVDDILIQHVANSRVGFAKGALTAAEWLIGKEGVFGMDDLLNLNK